MTKKEYCKNKKSIAYYSGLNGLEIKGIEYGINDFIYCISNCWYGGKKHGSITNAKFIIQTIVYTSL